jgi:hypothetical protein
MKMITLTKPRDSLRDRVHEVRFRRRSRRCEEELGIPYLPWVEALSHYVRTGPLRLLRATSHGTAASWRA